MAQFLGTHQGRLDAKSRVSIPAPFRASLKAESHSPNPAAGAPLVLRRSHQEKCIEVWPEKAFEALSAPLAKLARFSPERNNLALALFADAHQLETDKEGRIVLPANLITYAGLTDRGIQFLGVGDIFQIWDATLAERRLEQARVSALEQGYTLPGLPS